MSTLVMIAVRFVIQVNPLATSCQDPRQVRPSLVCVLVLNVLVGLGWVVDNSKNRVCVLSWQAVQSFTSPSSFLLPHDQAVLHPRSVVDNHSTCTACLSIFVGITLVC